MQVSLKNRATGEVRRQKIGWSWTCFFFSPVFGIPLFVRQLYAWGALMAGLAALDIMTTVIEGGVNADVSGIDIALWAAEVGLSIFFAIKANGMAGKYLLEHGWVFNEPDNEVTIVARQRWGLPVGPKVAAE